MKYETQRNRKGVLLCIPVVCLTLFLLFLPGILSKNASWRDNGEIIKLIETSLTADSKQIDKDIIIEEPYIVIFLDGDSEYFADTDDAKIWKKPFAFLTDKNIEKINTFIFVHNKEEYFASYTDGSRVSTYSTYIRYFDNDGEFMGYEFIEAEPLPDKKTSGNAGGVSNNYIAKYKVMDLVKQHLE